jgi:hypothetical protein
MEDGEDTKWIKKKEKEIIFSVVFDGSYCRNNVIERQEVL